MNPPFAEYCDAKLKEIEAAGLLRQLRNWEVCDTRTIRLQGRVLLNFSSNDYLGLSTDRRIRDAAQSHPDEPAGAAASRLLTGNHTGYELLEDELAHFKQTETALVFTSGYAAALGTIPSVVGQGDFIVMDKLCHACLVDGARLSGATIRVYPHNNLKRCEELLLRCRSQADLQAKVLLLTESLFSMDGDLAPLHDLAELKRKHGAWLMVDEAHATGVLGKNGRGGAEQCGVAGEVDISMGTLSKAIGCVGGFISGSRLLRELLINRARSLIFSTGLPPALCRAAAVAVRIARDEPSHREKLWRNIRHIGEQLKQVVHSPIVPYLVGDERRCLEQAEKLLQAGIMVPAVRFPTVPRGKARLRISITAAHTEDDLTRLAGGLAELSLPA